MATSRSCIKCFKSTCEIVFLLYLVVKILQLVHKIAVFPRRSIKQVFWKTSQNSIQTDKHKEQSYRGVLWKRNMFLNILQNSQKNIFSGVSFLTTLQTGNLKPSEAATRDILWNKVLLKISQISQEIICVGVSF